MKQFVISVALFFVSSLASANLAQNTVVAVSHQPHVTTNSYSHAISYLADASHIDNRPSKTETMYSILFEYSSHINQVIDHEGLAVFWKHALISTALNAKDHSSELAKAHLPNPHVDDEVLQFVANSLNDDYENVTDQSNAHVNEVPVPAAIWLFSSAILLFGFARRSAV